MNDGEKASNGPSLDQGGSEDFCATSIEDGLEHPAAPASGGQLGVGLEECGAAAAAERSGAQREREQVDWQPTIEAFIDVLVFEVAGPWQKSGPENFV